MTSADAPSPLTWAAGDLTTKYKFSPCNKDLAATALFCMSDWEYRFLCEVQSGVKLQPFCPMLLSARLQSEVIDELCSALFYYGYYM